jgi:hypothetical protein
LIADPANGSSVIQAGDFPDAHRCGATLTEYVFTKA